ncbi:MAG: type II secretion system secretin GspD [Proteobacteria bacterium]|nr:type II secretion system secretin GspD [Pseudomonadota bacterium]
MLAVQAVRHRLGWGATKILVCALTMLTSACSSVGDNAQRHPAESQPTASKSAEYSAPKVPVETTAQATKPSGGVDVLRQPSRSSLSEPEFYRGSGALVHLRDEGRAAAPVSETGRVSLNFVDVSIREMVAVVLGDTLNLNYIIDPAVRGTVVARTSDPLDREDVIPAVESILALNGVALRLVDGIYHILPLEQAGRSSAEPRSALTARARAMGFTATVIPLRFASAPTIHKVMSNFVSADRVFLADPIRNLLVFAGTSSEVDNLENMVQLFDVDWMAGMSFALLPVKIADVSTLISELENVFSHGGEAALENVVRFVPIERMNAVLAISPQQAYLDRARVWIERLDRGDGIAGQRIFVYYVQNSRAAHLADILTQIFGSIDVGIGEVRRELLAPVLTPVNLVGSAPVISELAAQAENQGEAVPALAQANRSRLQAAYDVDRRLGGGLPSESIGALISETGNIRVIADEKNNALVILSTPEEFRMIEATLERLDIVPLQVLIEATIAEVSLTDDLKYGLEWFFTQGNFSTAFSDSAAGVVAPAFPGFSLLFSTTDARVVLNALTEVTDVNVISSPQLMVLDNETAFLNIGDQVPISTQSAVSVTDATAPIVNTIQYRDTGVVLEITPRVNANGLVVLDVIQEVSDVIETTTSEISSPTIQQRRIETTVAVQSGETVALGGLIRDIRSDSISGIPLLSDIPILGNLFKTNSESTRRTELIILITPRVIHNSEEATEAMEELRGRMKGLQPLQLKL